MLSGSLFSSRAFGSNLSSCSLLRVAVMEDDLVSQAASSVGPMVLATLAVCFTLSKACVCCLCNAKSTDPSPLVGERKMTSMEAAGPGTSTVKCATLGRTSRSKSQKGNCA